MATGRHITILGMGPSAYQRAHDIGRYIPDESELWGLNNGYLTFPGLREEKRFDRMYELHSWDYLATWDAGPDPLTGKQANHFACLEQLGCEVITGQHLPIVLHQTQIDWEGVFGHFGPPVYFLGSPSVMLAQALYEHDHGQTVEQIDSWGIDTADPSHMQQRASWAYWTRQAIARGIKFGGTALQYMREHDNDEGLSGIRDMIAERLSSRRHEGPVTDYAVASFCTDDDHYLPLMARLEAQAKSFGLEFVSTVVPVPKGKTSAQVAKHFPATMMRDLLKKAGKPILYIDADDELLARPSFPACDVGVMRNPELDCMGTHLQLAPFMFIVPGRGANAFLGYRERSMESINGHRGVNVAYTALRHPRNRHGTFIDVSQYVKGCIRYNPSPSGVRPQTLTT